MARVPIARNLIQQGPATTAKLQAFDHGGEAIAQGLVQLGAGINDFAQFRQQVQTEQAELGAKDADNAFAVSVTETIDDPANGLRAKQGRGAVEALEPTLEALQKRRDELANGLKSPLARKLFMGVAEQRMQSATSAMYRHVAVERERWQDETELARVGLSVSDAGNSFDDLATADKHIATAVNELAAYGKRKGWDDDKLALETLKTVSEARRGIGRRIADVDPDLAERYDATYGAQMLPEDRDAVRDGIRIRRAQILAEQRRQEAEQRQAQREETALVSEQARDVLDMVDNGHEVDTKSITKLAGRLDELGKPVLAIRLRTAGEVQTFTSEARQWRPDQLQGWINEQRAATKGNVTPGQAARIDAGEKLLGRMRGRLKSDPLSWAVEAGVARLSPVDFRNPASAQARVKTALAVSERYGIRPTFLTDEETGLIAGQLASAKPQDKVKLTAAIVGGFGRYGREVLGSISGADPVFAHAAGLAVSVPNGKDTAQRIFAGQEALRDKSVSIPSHAAFENAPTLGRALAYTPKTRGALMASAKAIYASEAAAAGLDPKIVDEDVWAKAVNRAAGATYRQDGSRVGGIGSYRGNNIILPSDVSPDEIDTLMGRLSADDLKGAKPTFGNGKPVDIDTIRSGYLFDAGSGRYFVSLDKAGTQFVRGPRGHFVLDLGALVPRLRARAPQSISGRIGEWLGF